MDTTKDTTMQHVTDVSIVPEATAEFIAGLLERIEQLESDLATAEQDSRQKQARIDRLEQAAQAMTKEVLMKTLYEINWHYADNEETKFSHCTVTPIEVLREGILPGCSAVSITAKGSDGRTFQGSPHDYFESEAAAWAQAKQDLIDTIQHNDEEIERLKDETHRLFSFWIKLPATED